MKSGIIEDFPPRMRKGDSDALVTQFDCYKKSHDKLILVDVGKELKVDGKTPALALLLNKSDDQEINSNGEFVERSSKLNESHKVRRSNRNFGSPEHLISVPYFQNTLVYEFNYS